MISDAGQSSVVPPGGYLCFLDSSPKLPSSLLANHIAYRVRGLSNPDDTLNVLGLFDCCRELMVDDNRDGALQMLLQSLRVRCAS